LFKIGASKRTEGQIMGQGEAVNQQGHSRVLIFIFLLLSSKIISSKA